MDSQAARNLLASLRMCYPIFLLVLFMMASLTSTIIVTSKNNKHGFQTKSDGLLPSGQARKVKDVGNMEGLASNIKSCFKWLSLGILITYVMDGGVFVVHVIISWPEHWWGGQSVVIHFIGSSFIYMVIVMKLLDGSCPTASHFVCWIFAIPVEIAIFSMSLWLYTSQHREPVAGDPEGGPLRKSITIWESMEVASNGIRVLGLLALALMYAFKSFFVTGQDIISTASSTETTALLAPTDIEAGDTNVPRYSSTSEAMDFEVPNTIIESITACSRSLRVYLSGYSLFLPYMWPSNSRGLQTVVILCFLLLVLQRAINILIPAQIGAITTALANREEANFWSSPPLEVFMYVLYCWLQESLSSLRSGLWIPMSQYSYMELSTAAFEHVHSLDLEFHLNKKTGEVLSALNKGKSVTAFLEQIVFQFIPTLCDLVIVVGYLLVAFDYYYALIVGFSSITYLYVTVSMAQWRAESNRQMTDASRHEEAFKNDSIVSYPTVKFFNREIHEFGRYRDHVRRFQEFQFHSLLRGTLLSIIQSTTLKTCLLYACMIAVLQVSANLRPVGQFVTLLMYMAQLQGPLSYFGNFYISIQSALINAERMLELLQKRATIVDSAWATPMATCEGNVQFQEVEFAYDTRSPVLNGITFCCKSGTTTAIVGESGAGKSTIFQLLFRFYDANKGNIYVDGHSVRDITINSLRSHIGVVSQETQLFNDSIMYNLKYANPEATDDEVHEACRAAGIHDRIMGLPDGYKSKVGDRGLRLSGGEKQRLAIARVIPKDASIIMLDEATAALDTGTEEHIQKALESFATGRTMLVIAHRLSTVTNADQIVVVHAGKVAEIGTHKELSVRKGRYAEMWKRHIQGGNSELENTV
ncbi:ABC transporterintegral membrane type 1 [Penicillium lividum]|nr:ABC transporterintegral membrane type 1 [Penicillium lividum]